MAFFPTDYTNPYAGLRNIQPSKPQDARYRSVSERIFDPNVNPSYLATIYHSPMDQAVVQEWRNPLKVNSLKDFNAVVPTNTMPSHAAVREFDRARLSQTLVTQGGQIESDRSLAQAAFPVSLDAISARLKNKIGVIHGNVKNVGTCALICSNLVMTARHVVEGKDIRTLSVTFGYVDDQADNPLQTTLRCAAIVEDDPEHDYVLIQLEKPLPAEYGYVELSTEGSSASELALLHYPQGRPLTVSVHAVDQFPFQSEYLTTFHDSNYVSSGGIYFDALGRLIAMHIGAQLEGDEVNLCRYAITLKAIVTRNPYLARFANGEWSQAFPYNFSSKKYLLEPYPRDFLIDEEGYRSKIILTDELKTSKDRKIRKSKTGVSFSTENLEYVERVYATSFQRFLEQCLYKSGIHGTTRQYSVVGYIESDHTIPYDVWSSTKNLKMSRLLKGTEKRPGENALPAITIPYNEHRELLTTGSSDGAKNFRARLVKLCNQDKIDQALIACFEEYQNKGIKVDRALVQQSLKEHIQLKVLTKAEGLNVISNLGLKSLGKKS